jgi:hypothetical protein
LNCAIATAPIVVSGVAIIANLARPNIAVAADDVPCAFALLGTGPVLFLFADAVTAITGQDVAIVALLNITLIVDSVATALGYLFDASRGRVRAVAYRR